MVDLTQNTSTVAKKVTMPKIVTQLAKRSLRIKNLLKKPSGLNETPVK